MKWIYVGFINVVWREHTELKLNSRWNSLEFAGEREAVKSIVEVLEIFLRFSFLLPNVRWLHHLVE